MPKASGIIGGFASPVSSWTHSALYFTLGLCIIGVSFWLTLKIVDHWDQGETMVGNPIKPFGNSSVSQPVLRESTVFHFKGQGYAEIADAENLRCLNSYCSFSLLMKLHDLKASPAQLILGQSISGEPGWHLLFTGSQLVLQTDGAGTQVATAFSPEQRREYKIEIATDEHGVTIAVDDVIITKSKLRPFLDVNRGLYIGGRPGTIPLGLTGEIRGLMIKQRAGVPGNS